MRGLYEQYLALVEKCKNPSLSWEDFADIRYESTGIRESAETLRKGAKLFYEYLNAGWIKPPEENMLTTYQSIDGEDFDLQDMQLQRYELEKEKIKVRDERNELRRLIREEARKESFVEQVLRGVQESNFAALPFDTNRREITFSGNNDLIVTMTDLHTGIEIDNYFNRFNNEVLKERLTEYVEKIVEVQSLHRSEKCYVILSELINGIIHSTLRIENNQNVIEQFLTVTAYISQALAELSYYFKEVNVFVCPGNHSRVSPNKNEAYKGENFDHLVLPFLEAKLQNFKNIKYHYNKLEESIAIFEVRGQVVMAAHGDKDSPANVVQHFSNMFNVVPNVVVLGHRHQNSMSMVGTTMILQAGCLSGMDNYCCDMRLRNIPQQLVAVVNNKGVGCVYNMTFEK